MGGPTEYLQDMCKGYRIQGRGEVSISLVVTVSCRTTTESHVKYIFCRQCGTSNGGNPEGLVDVRKGIRSRSLEVVGEGKAGEGFVLCWERDGLRPGGRMIPCRTRTEGEGWGGRILYDRIRGWGGSNK